MWLGLATLCAAVLSLAGIFLYLNPQIPKAETYRNVKLETPLRVYAENGALLAEYGERRLIPITLDQVPVHFINALLDTEDKRFYEHSGIDFISLTNDALSLIGTFVTEGELGGGASTITMQLARNVSFTLDRRFLRKFKEMLLALKVERELSKDEILELYINLVPFGKRAYGAEAAARTYYGKSLNQLALPQLAMLAGIPQAPTAGNPVNGPQRALARRNLVLSRMFAQGSITEHEFQQATAAPITAKIFARDLDVPSPYAAEWVRQFGSEMLSDLYTAGYEIHTTVDAGLQAEAIRALRKGLMTYDRRHGYRGAEAAAEPELAASLNANAVDLLKSEPLDEQQEMPLSQELTNQIMGALRDIPTFGGLPPAMVVAVNDERALTLRDDGSLVSLELADSEWARQYIEVDLRGPIPTSMAEILTAGDIVRLRYQQDRWLLAQVPEIQGAVVSLDPLTGSVRALVGGFDFYRNQYNHALQAARQPGSGFKPFVYSAALDAGVTPADVFLDAPLVFEDANLESQYRPDNDDNSYNGPTRLRVALYRSINLVSMRVLLKVGAGNVLEHVSKFGFNTRNFPRNTQLAIGGGTMAVTPIDMARAYAVLANGGYLIDPHIVSRITSAEGVELFQANHPRVCADCENQKLSEELPLEEIEPASLVALLEQVESLESALAAPRVLDERNVFVMHSMLQDVIRRGTGIRASRELQRTDLAGKTGTTNDAADTWFNGYSPEVVTSVWVGFGNHAPLGATAYGSNTPLPIWIDVMRKALSGHEEIQPVQPPGVVTMKIDPDSGKLANPGQTDAIFEYFLREYAPQPTITVEPPRPGRRPGEDIKAIDLFGD